MKNFTITTLGCKVNQCESETIASALKKYGFSKFAADQEEPQFCIINTCTVTRKASMQSRQEIRKAIRSYPNAKIIVTGCYAQTEPDKIKKIKGVHYVVGQSEKNRIPEIIISSSVKCQTKLLERESGLTSNLFNDNDRIRGFLKIQDGCNAFCTYCIVPYARGRSKSLSFNEALNQMAELKSAGYREVVLTGIHLGIYGEDLVPKTSLYNLLKHMEKKQILERVRLSSIEPCELSDNIIKLVSESDIFCKHFHIPLQSGNDNILKRMHRPYRNQFIKNLVNKIHQLIPDAAIGSDFLIGFPGEDDEAFESTCSLIEELPITHLHVFPFSQRNGTPAANYSDQINPKIIKQRCKKVRSLGNIKKNEFYKKFVKKEVKILVEGKKTSKGLLKGITSNYIPVFFKGTDDLINTFVQVRIDKINKNGLPYATIQN